MASTFTWTPSKSFSNSNKARVITAQFGDGYSQRIGNGINRFAKTWTLQFTSIGVDTAAEITSFLEGTEGVYPFNWTPPGEAKTYAVTCQEWNVRYDSHISRSIDLVFTQVFEKLV